MQTKNKYLYIFFPKEFLNINKMAIKNYIKELLKAFPKIASGRKKFYDHEKRIKENIRLTKKYMKKNN